MNVASNILSVGADAADAIIAPGEALNFAELRLGVGRVAETLRAHGHIKGERIGILAENGSFFVEAYLGIIHAGLVAVPLQTESSSQSLSRIAADAGMSRALVSPRFFQRTSEWASRANMPLLTQQDFAKTRGSTHMSAVEMEPTDLAALMFTSGSTGTPKGVMITHRNIECNTRDIISYLGLQATDRVMVVLPFHYCFGLSLLHTHFMVGATLVLNNVFRAFPEQMLQELQEQKCTGLAGVPSTYQILLRKTRFRELTFPNLRWFQQAGGKLPNACIAELVEAFPQVRFFLMYGQTEATARLSYLPPERLQAKLGSIGRGLPSTHLEVLGSDGKPVVPGTSQTGEIVATGDNIAPGYWNDPKETSAYFKNGSLHTGDLGRVDEDGFIYFVERERDMLKPGGNRVSGREIEDAISELPEVVEVAVIGVPHELLGEAIHAFVVLNPDAGSSTESIRTHCRRHLPAHKAPHQITSLRSMPHNSAGKILKSKLREFAERPEPNSAHDPSSPASPVVSVAVQRV